MFKKPLYTIINNKYKLPIIGVNFNKVSPNMFNDLFLEACKKNITFFETSQFSNNEYLLGEAIQEFIEFRDDIFLMTRIWTSNCESRETFFKSIEQTFNRLQTTFLDLVTLHWVGENALDAYKWLIELREEGKIHSIGLSHFDLITIKKIVKTTGVVPDVVELEISIIEQQQELVDWLREFGIVIMAKSIFTNELEFPISHNFTNKDLKIIHLISEKYQISSEELMMQVAFNKGFVCSVDIQNLKYINIDEIIEIDEKDWEKLNKLNRDSYQTLEYACSRNHFLWEILNTPNPLIYEKFYIKRQSDGMISEGSVKTLEMETKKR